LHFQLFIGIKRSRDIGPQSQQQSGRNAHIDTGWQAQLVIIVSIVCDLLLFQVPCETETWHCLPAVSGLKPHVNSCN